MTLGLSDAGMWDWDWWHTPKAARLADRLFRRARPGDIVVIHDGHHRNPKVDRRHAAGTVRLLVPQLRQRGFSFAPLCRRSDSLAPEDRSGIEPRGAARGQVNGDERRHEETREHSQVRSGIVRLDAEQQ